MAKPEERSKYLSYILRHKPEKVGLTLDTQGWCEIDLLCQKTDFTPEELLAITLADEKQRYSISPDGKKIRANQGHSTGDVSLNFKEKVPPSRLFHGTTSAATTEIEKRGLLPMSRHYVHMSADVDTAASVGGRRRGDATIFEINCVAAFRDGIKFYLSDNSVWLARSIPAKYLKRMT